jgi:biotin transporter BioY
MHDVMKQEDHVAQLSVSLILQVFVLLLAAASFGVRDYYSFQQSLLVVLLLGLSLLPVIAAIRRGPMAAKACGLMLALLPADYAYGLISFNWPIIVHEWLKL